MNRKDNAKSARVTDALLNYETVKYFSNEHLEVANLGTAIGEYQEIEFKLLASLAALNVLQSTILFTGLVCGLLVCVKASFLPRSGSCMALLVRVADLHRLGRCYGVGYSCPPARLVQAQLDESHKAELQHCIHRHARCWHASLSNVTNRMTASSKTLTVLVPAGGGPWQPDRGRCCAVHRPGAAAVCPPQLLWLLLPPDPDLHVSPALGL